MVDHLLRHGLSKDARSDVERFVPPEIVEACVGDFHERLPMTGFVYSGFVDPSGGSDAAMTLAIGHKTATPEKQIVIDLIREVRPPFDPAAVVDNFAALLKTYRVSKVLGDHYGGEFVRAPFREQGINYEVCKTAKSDLFRDLLPLLTSRHIILPRHHRLIAQIVGLERRVSRAGKDSIAHAPQGQDDLVNAVAGCAAALHKSPFMGCGDKTMPTVTLTPGATALAVATDTLWVPSGTKTAGDRQVTAGKALRVYVVRES